MNRSYTCFNQIMTKVITSKKNFLKLTIETNERNLKPSLSDIFKNTSSSGL